MQDLISIFLQVLDKLPVTLLMLAFSLVFGLFIGTGVAIVRIRHEPISYSIATF